MRPNARSEATKKGILFYYNGKPCPQGHIGKRSTKSGGCYECRQQSLVRWRAANPEKCRKSFERWWRNRTEAHKTRHRTYAKAYYERVKDTSQHKAGTLARTRRRQAQQLKAMPKWVDDAVIRKIYENRPPGFEVDHIVPLLGKTVCGLHVPWNLRYLPASENRKRPKVWVVE